MVEITEQGFRVWDLVRRARFKGVRDGLEYPVPASGTQGTFLAVLEEQARMQG